MFPLATTVQKKKETSSAMNSFCISVTHTVVETESSCLSAVIPYVYITIAQYMGGDMT